MKGIIYRDIFVKRYSYFLMMFLALLSLRSGDLNSVNLYFFYWMFHSLKSKTFNTVNYVYPISLIKQMMSVMISSVLMFGVYILIFMVLSMFKSYSPIIILEIFKYSFIVLFFSMLTIFEFSKLSGNQWLISIVMGLLQFVIVMSEKFYPLEVLVYGVILGFLFICINAFIIYYRERGRYYVGNTESRN